MLFRAVRNDCVKFTDIKFNIFEDMTGALFGTPCKYLNLIMYFFALHIAQGVHLWGRGTHPLPSKRKVSLYSLFAPKMPHKGLK